jgi:hypothetical protein
VDACGECIASGAGFACESIDLDNNIKRITKLHVLLASKYRGLSGKRAPLDTSPSNLETFDNAAV